MSDEGKSAEVLQKVRQENDRSVYCEIAERLGVPETKKAGFVDQALQLSDLIETIGKMTEKDGLESRRNAIKALQDIRKSLEKAQKSANIHPTLFDLSLSTKFRASLGSIISNPKIQNQFRSLPELSERDIRHYWNPETQDSYSQDLTPELGTVDPPVVFAENPGSAFVELLGLQSRMVMEELEIWKINPGGRPEKEVRRYFLQEFLNLHYWAFGTEATSAPGGTYNRMCEHLFMSFGVPIDGLETAIKRFLSDKNRSAK